MELVGAGKGAKGAEGRDRTTKPDSRPEKEYKSRQTE